MKVGGATCGLYNRRPMKHRTIAAVLVAMLLPGFAGLTNAQSFGSVSNQPPPRTSETTAAPAAATPVPEAPAFSSSEALARPTPAEPVAVPAATSSIGNAANGGTVAATGAAAKPWQPAPFFSAPKIPTTPVVPASVPATPAAAGASEPPQPAPAASAFSSVSGVGAGTTGDGGSGPSLPQSDAGGTSFVMAERIVIEKGKRRLMLLRGSDVIATYPVKLGLNPYGHKQREGDFRTPEGTYYLSRRNPRSEFFLSVEVSYPSAEDRARARAAGVRPGGLIMIHGQPNVPRKSPQYYASNDWTDGCIAVSNSDMVDIWLRTRVGTPIEIKP